MKLFLDDIRSPQDCAKYMHTRIGAKNPIYTEGDWYTVRNYEQFKKAIERFASSITHISFDHDLADAHYHESMYEGGKVYMKYLETISEKTGLDCAKFVIEYYSNHAYNWPEIFVHSMNPVGTENIHNAFND